MDDQAMSELSQAEESTQQNKKNVLFGKNSANVDEFESFLKSVPITRPTDPVLLKLWIERERKKYELKTQTKPVEPKPKTLARSSSVFLALLVMILSILLGLSEGKEADLILSRTCLLMCCFALVGYVLGRVLENCVAESSRELIREVLQRSETEEGHGSNVTA